MMDPYDELIEWELLKGTEPAEPTFAESQARLARVLGELAELAKRQGVMEFLEEMVP